MSTDFRALCAELLQGLDENRHPEVRYPGHLRIVMARARAALAQPEPEPVALTDEDLYDLAEVFNGEPVASMRRALELWGTPAIAAELEAQ
jgi:hypothetical protein